MEPLPQQKLLNEQNLEENSLQQGLGEQPLFIGAPGFNTSDGNITLIQAGSNATSLTNETGDSDGASFYYPQYNQQLPAVDIGSVQDLTPEAASDTAQGAAVEGLPLDGIMLENQTASNDSIPQMEPLAAASTNETGLLGNETQAVADAMSGTDGSLDSQPDWMTSKPFC